MFKLILCKYMHYNLLIVRFNLSYYNKTGIVGRALYPASRNQGVIKAEKCMTQH